MAAPSAPILFFLSASLAVAFALPAPARAEEDLEVGDEALADAIDENEDDEDVDPIEEHKRDEADRTHVSGNTPGSLASPLAIKDETRLKLLCDALQSEKHGLPEGDPAALAIAKRAALRDVYTVSVPPGGFKLGEYRSRAGRLPLRLDHPLIAVDGAVRLIAAQKAGGAFDIKTKEAAALLASVEEKKIGLEVTFRVDRAMAETMPPCFSYPKSAAYALNIEPLSFALVEVANNNKRVVEAKTPALEELKTWMNPGKARLAIIATSEGPVDSDALSKAIEAKRGELEGCFGPMMQSVSGTGMVSYEAAVAPSGAVTEVRREAESLDDSNAGECAAKILAAVSAPKAPKTSRAHVSLTVERGEDELETLTD